MNAKTESITRRYDLDWLRVAGILCVFLFHSLRFFDLEDWSIKNAVTSTSAQVAINFLASWLMPLMFVISGASVFYAVCKSSAGQFVKDKVLRLLVPLAMTAFTHASLQVYVERVSHGQFSGSYFQFLPHYFQGIYMPGGTGNFAVHGMHLWYVALLFIFCLVLLPVLYAFKSGLGRCALAKAGDILALPGAIILLLLPTIVMENTMSGDGLLGLKLGGWSIERYVWFFLAGFIVMSSERLVRRIAQMRWLCLALASILVITNIRSGARIDQHIDLLSWLWILTFLGFGFKYLNVRASFLSYANEAVLPFYVMHQTVLLCVGYFIVTWPISDVAKWLLIAPSSFAIIIGLYEFAVRRNNILRVLFGMKPLPAYGLSRMAYRGWQRPMGSTR